jgi:RNA polymerase sigma factor (sigma-70 family)
MLAHLRQGMTFLARYHRLIGVVVARCVLLPEDARDAFVDVCDRLSQDDLARLRRFHEAPTHRAKFSTWLVVVVRNLAIDWRRARDGRARATPPPGLSALRERIYQLVLVERQPRVETYEALKARGVCDIPYPEFVREISATMRSVDSRRWAHLALMHGLVPEEASTMSHAPDVERSEEAERLERALAQLTERERAAVQLFVVEGRPAAEVAQVVGLPNAKAVYNRVSRALATLRGLLSREG